MKHPKYKKGDEFTNKHGAIYKIIEHRDCYNVEIEFQDEHKHRLVAQASQLRLGTVGNPYTPTVFGMGYLGVGKYKSQNNHVVPTYSRRWRNMLARCYVAKVQEKYPSYVGCTVSDEWLNFQNYAEWFSSQKYNDIGYEVDKDLLVTGNKIYSKDTCLLIPKEINTLILGSNSRNNNLPTGVNFDKASGLFRSRHSIGNKKHRELGFFDCQQEACQAYVIAKEAYVKEVANKWRGRIDELAYDALMNWTVNP